MVFGHRNYLRRFCAKIVTWNYFDAFIIFVIVVSAINLSLYNPL